MLKNTEPKKQKRGGRYLALALVLAAAGWYWLRPAPVAAGGTVFVVRRGTLPINVVEGGSIEALESQEIRSEIKGHQGTKILSIVEEGYLVTEEDIAKEKILVELDSSELKQRITTQDIQFQSTLASLTEAQQGYDIQINQNLSDIKSGEQKVRFARMDLEKYLGDQASREVISILEKSQAAQTTAPPESKPVASVAAPTLADAAAVPLIVPKAELAAGVSSGAIALVDFTRYAKIELLGDGEAKQKLRKFEDDLLVAKSEHGISKTQFEGTQRLSQKGFITKNTLQNEEITVQKNALKVQTAETAQELFIKYEFPKAAEEFLSKYEEAARLLDRARKEAVSKLAQAEAKLKSAEGRYRLEQDNRTELQDQLSKCTIKAKKNGLVVYGGGNENMNYYGQEQIREGATVRERQPIITIPDMTQMSVRVKIHESHIKKIKKGLKATIRVDAFPDEILEGEVTKVGVLPDSQNRWMNPDLKVYVTSIKIIGVRDWVKPGMSSKVDIKVKDLPNVVHVPIQAISAEGMQRVCHLVNGGKRERRVVEIGEFNDEFIEIKSGLKEGDKVLLLAPEATKPDGDGEKKEEAPVPVPPPQPA